MDMFLNLERASVHLHHHAEIHIECRSILRERIVESIFHESSRILLVLRRNMGLHVFRIEVLQWIETTVVIYLRLHIAVLVQHHHRRDAGSCSHFLIVSSESRSDMYDTCSSLIYRDIVSRNHSEGVAFERFEPRNQLMISDAHQFRSLECSVENLERNKFVARFVILE